MIERDSKVLGYIGVSLGTINVICDGDSCVVAGSEEKMKQYISAFGTDGIPDSRITKARYGHVMQAVRLGGAYSFDEESFSRFRPLAAADGLNLVEFTPSDRSKPNGPAIHLMRVQWIVTK